VSVAPAEIDPPVRTGPTIHLRKVMRIGGSACVSIDPQWARDHVPEHLQYVAASVHDDGSYRIYPASHPDQRDERPPDPP
jgi:hypothetical protein